MSPKHATVKYAAELAALDARIESVNSAGRRLHFNVLRGTAAVIKTDVAAYIEQMCAGNEAFRRMPTEQKRVGGVIEQEQQASRTRTAGVARFYLEPALERLDTNARDLSHAIRFDPSLDFPHALDGLDKAAMLMYRLLVETLRASIDALGPADLLRRHQVALDTPDDAASLAAATLVEERVARGGLAQTAEQLPAVKKLTDHLERVQAARLPVEELCIVPDVLEFCRRQLRNAELASIRPINPEHPLNSDAKLAFDGEADLFAASLAAAAKAEAAADAAQAARVAS
jgi:hypothetical protein